MKTIEQCEISFRHAMRYVMTAGLDATREKLIDLLGILKAETPDSLSRFALLADCNYAVSALESRPPFGDGIYVAALIDAMNQCEAVRMDPAAPQEMRRQVCFCEAHALSLLSLVRHAIRPIAEAYPSCSIDDMYRGNLTKLIGEFDRSSFGKLATQRVNQLLAEARGPVTWLDFHQAALQHAIKRWDATGVAWR